jgi:hypothetical protein
MVARRKKVPADCKVRGCCSKSSAEERIVRYCAVSHKVTEGIQERIAEEINDDDDDDGRLRDL